jgi:hypothetical protein
MAESEKELELEARIIALEYLVKQCLTNILSTSPQGDDYFGDDYAVLRAKRFRAEARKALRKAAISGDDPVKSDHVSGLVFDYVDHLLDEMIQEMKVKLSRSRST